MPELPEVERVARNRRIVKVTCARDPIVFEGVGAARIKRALLGRTVIGTARRGKHLWFELDRRPWPCFHLGMTGSFRTQGEAPLQLASSPRVEESSWPPRFTKLCLVFDDGGELAVTNKRRLGRIRLRHDPPQAPPIRHLGFDPLLDLPSSRRFSALLAGRSAVVKTLLLDQAFAAGVGNWIADEVLYQARIDPRRRADQLTVGEGRRLRARLKQVVETAVQANADKSLFPRSWLFHRRWKRDVKSTTIRGHEIEYLTIGGRTTAWVPSLQR